MSKSLLQLLRDKRNEIATREGKALYMIFSNETLELTAAAKPTTRIELAVIKGWGAKKIEKYGDEVLAIIHSQGIHTLQQISLIDGSVEQSSPFQFSKPIKIANPGVLSVEQYLDVVNSKVAELGTLKVLGEINDLKLYGPMAFFDLKDPDGAEAVAKCFLGRWNFDKYSHLMDAGMEVIITGRPSVHKTGNFRLVVESVEPVGEGVLQKAFEALKKKLESKGYFEESRKRALPGLIQKIAVITSESGAVINDFRQNIGEYGFEILLRDVRVEGDMAEESIVSAFRYINKHCPDADVIVLIRGGGGLENLKAFNSEAVAEAIITSRLPVVTGIGHERDETIAGYLSDRNFSTPTAVAAFIRRQREEILMALKYSAEALATHVEAIFYEFTRNMNLRQESVLAAFSRVLERYRFRVTRAASEMNACLGKVFSGFRELEGRFLRAFHRYDTELAATQHTVTLLAERSTVFMQQKVISCGKQVQIIEAALLPLDPEAILKRGYSVAYKNGKVLKNVDNVRKNDEIAIQLHQGHVITRVEQTKL
jgi:exodeoxyribonuclease VII large subunit